ncbi:MAG: hypothetical protein NZ890_12385 [Myxococcota bacterium]|nr:hypothetical protein [Myxococcota bacterium]
MGEPLRRLLCALALLLPGLALAETQQAAGSVQCTVRIIHARSEDGEVDPRLAPLRPQLSRPPMSSWRSFRLLQQHELRVGSEAPSTFAVPGEHEGALQFQGKVEGSKVRLRLRLEIRDGRARLLNTVFVIDDGGTMLHGGIRHGDGVLVTGITCRL